MPTATQLSSKEHILARWFKGQVSLYKDESTIQSVQS